MLEMEIVVERGERNSRKESSFVHPPTLVIGLGNPILGDDGVGWRVAEKVESSLIANQETDPDSLTRYPVEVDFLSLGGLSLMERLVGYHRVIIVDADTGSQNSPGAVRCLRFDDLPKNTASHLTAAHDTTLQTALELGRSMGIQLPEQIMIVAVSCEATFEFSEELTKPVEAAVQQAVDLVLQLLHNQ